MSVTILESAGFDPAPLSALETRHPHSEYDDILDYVNSMEVVGQRQVAGKPSTFWEVARPTGSFQAEVTQGPFGYESPVIVRLLGIAQSVHGSGESEVHEALAAAYPDYTIMTIGNNAIDTKNPVDSASRRETAAERHTFIRAFTNRTVPVKLLGTSLGGQTAHDIAEYNLDCDEPIVIDGVVLHASGLLDPEASEEIVDHKFLPALLTTTSTAFLRMGTDASIQAVQDILRGNFNVARRYKPVIHLANETWHAGVTVTNRHDAIRHQANMLRAGTSAERIRRVAARTILQVILHQNDPLARGHNWATIVPPGAIEILPGGHEGVFSPADTLSALLHALARLPAEQRAA